MNDVSDEYKRLMKMANDISTLTPINKPEIYKYIAFINAKDISSLEAVTVVLSQIQYTAKQIILMPATYSSCNFDCFTINDVCRSLRGTNDSAIDTICFKENPDLADGDFYIALIRERWDNKLKDLYTFSSYSTYDK